MIIKDKIYKFEFYNSADIGAKPFRKMYADSGDIYALEDIPQSCFQIFCAYKDLIKNGNGSEDDNWEFENLYMLGDEITTEEAKEEFEKLSKIEITDGYTNVKDETLATLKAYINQKPKDKIYINKNIELNEDSIQERLIISSWWSKEAIYISPKQIINGKIYPVGQVKSGEIEDDKSYTALE